MASSDSLRHNLNQHAPKNTKSKVDDKEIYLAMNDTIAYLNSRFSSELGGNHYHLKFEKSISFKSMINVIRSKNVRSEFDTVFCDRTIKPDGGVIVLRNQDNKDYYKIVLISEVKRQGTNDDREKEGKKKQAQGNAVERLGKNLIGIKAMMNHEKITPFVCFGWGCDFTHNYTEKDFVMSKISMLNEFYPLNRIHIFKKDGSSDTNFFSPVSMFFKEERWDRQSMFNICKEIGETSLRYYLY